MNNSKNLLELAPILGVLKCNLEVFEEFSRDFLLVSVMELLHKDIAYSSDEQTRSNLICKRHKF